MPIQLTIKPDAQFIRVLVMGEQELTDAKKAVFEKCLRPVLPVVYQQQVEPSSQEEWSCAQNPDLVLALPGYIPLVAGAINKGFRHVVETPFGDFIEITFKEEAFTPGLCHHKHVIVAHTLGGGGVSTSIQRSFRECFVNEKSVDFYFIEVDTTTNKSLWKRLGLLVEQGLIHAIVMNQSDMQYAVQTRTILQKDVPHVAIDSWSGQVRQLTLGRDNISK
ncbi:MAG: hypothetical protein WD509_00580 [Candidatus Paceibacterota bacterium]